MALATLIAVYAATRDWLPHTPCTVPTRAFQHRWNLAAHRVRADVSIADYLAIAGGAVLILGAAVARPGARVFLFAAPYAIVVAVA